MDFFLKGKLQKDLEIAEYLSNKSSTEEKPYEYKY